MNPMREARIILPVTDNEGRSLQALHDQLQLELCRLFGGMTATGGQGGWVDDNGKLVRARVVVYDVAVSMDDEFAPATLYRIAAEYGARAKQDCVFLRSPNGIAELVPPMEEAS